MITDKINKIKWLRSKLNISQNAMAELLGVKQQTISRWEKGMDSIKNKNVMACIDLAKKNKIKIAAESIIRDFL